MWSKKEEEFLKENYDKMSAAKIGRILGKNENTIRAKASRLKISKEGPRNNMRNCKGCIFLGKFGSCYCCDYILIKGERRGCDVSDCDKKLTKREAPKKIKDKIKKSKSTCDNLIK